MSDFCIDSTIKARKSHDCSECRNGIERGDTYHRYSGSCDGRMFTEKMCRNCYNLLDWVSDFKDFDFQEYHFGELGKNLDSHDVFYDAGELCRVSIETGVPVAHIKKIYR